MSYPTFRYAITPLAIWENLPYSFMKGIHMKKMNLPNKLTILRILLVPFIMAALLIKFPFHDLAAGLLFGAAAITDAFDGKIARRDNLITDFGKFADPLADKILVISMLVCFIQLGRCGAVPVCIILFREFAVTSVRLVAAANGKVIAANMWGKVKTVSQIVAIVAIFVMCTALEIVCLALTGSVLPETLGAITDYMAMGTLANLSGIFHTIADMLIWITAVITVISGIKYLVDNKEVISDM